VAGAEPLREQGFHSDDGVRLAYFTSSSDPPGGELPPVVLHHGFLADTASNWVGPGIVGALVAAGRRVVGIDARGHGRSDKPHDPAQYGRDRMARDVRLLADHLEFDRYDLIGYSMGAAVSLAVGADDHRVRRLAVGGVGAGVLTRVGVDGRVLHLDALADALLTDDPSSIHDPVARQFRDFAERMGNDLAAVAAQAKARAGSVAIPVDRITAPTLVYVGDADQLAKDADQLVQALASARLEVFKGDHLTMLGDPRLAPALVHHVGAA
jgi:pimeloyl-ACP methyl ester carboxylesterase